MLEKEYSFPKNKIKILLLERVHPIAIKRLEENGYSVESITRALDEAELMERMADLHLLGIRSKTKITAEHIKAAKKMLAIGVFAVGTNSVALGEAANHGIPVFNAPYGNTRSVAELALGHILSLARKTSDKNIKMHRKVWDKSAVGLYEVRDKTLGIIGYGHIGKQVGVLAEAVGLRVVFFDLVKQLPLGNCKQLPTIEEVLERSDFVTLHVPEQPGARNVIGRNELSRMKPGSYLINTSRGTVVDLPALRDALASKHLAGAAVDVFPNEPKSNDEPFECELTGMENVILTPHIGGSTEEAQENIGSEVATSFIRFVDAGTTTGAVNFPPIDMPFDGKSHRILNIHRNVPGVLSAVNSIVSRIGANINAQYLSTYQEVGYLIMDLNRDVARQVSDELSRLETSIKTRILY